MSDLKEDYDEDAQADAELDGEDVDELDEDAEIDELDDPDIDELDDETAEDLKAVDDVLSQKELNARSLAIRRALEQRLEEKRMTDDLDFLDLDLDD